MVSSSGTASLPLHYGRVPRWLSERMAELGAAITEAVLLEEGRAGFLSRLSDPLWFQAFGAVLGMDWHSSGITTAVMGALKRGLEPRAEELGLYVCGGRGKHSRRTPAELQAVAERSGLDGQQLARTSRLVAKVDSAAVQDGHQLYLHSFVLGTDGQWVVVQQGMNTTRRTARRYHWRSAGLRSFVDEPHDAMVGPKAGRIVNLTDRRAGRARQASLELVRAGPDAVVQELRATRSTRRATLPAHHEVRASDVFLRRLHGVLAVAAEQGAASYDQLLLTPGMGARAVQALALVAEVVHGAPSRFDDPARFAFAHGGKDGHPHPVPLRIYDETIGTLRHALGQAKVGRSDKIEAFQRLDARARELERMARGPSLERLIDQEWARAEQLDGRTVLGPAAEQLRLFA